MRQSTICIVSVSLLAFCRMYSYNCYMHHCFLIKYQLQKILNSHVTRITIRLPENMLKNYFPGETWKISILKLHEYSNENSIEIAFENIRIRWRQSSGKNILSIYLAHVHVVVIIYMLLWTSANRGHYHGWFRNALVRNNLWSSTRFTQLNTATKTFQ